MPMSLLGYLFIGCVLAVGATATDKICVRRVKNLENDKEAVCVVTDDATAGRLDVNNLNATLMRLGYHDGCSAYPAKLAVKGKLVAVLSNKCNISIMMTHAKDAGAWGLMIVANLTEYPNRLDIGQSEKPIPVVLIASNLYALLLTNTNKKPELRVQLLPAPATGNGFAAELCFFALTFVCLSTAMWLSLNGLADCHGVYGAPPTRNNSAKKENETKSVFCGISVFVVFSVINLLLLYFFYDIFVWVMMVLLCIIFTLACKSMGMEIILRLFKWWKDRCTVIIRKRLVKDVFGDSIDVGALLLSPLFAIPSILWLVFRRDPFKVWPIQDICGFFLCVYFLKSVRLGNLKVITLLSVAFFAYDIFMVYITPLFMPASPAPRPMTDFSVPMWRGGEPVTISKRSSGSGVSVMEAVATGSAGKSGERLPLLFLIPLLNLDGSYTLKLNMNPRMACFSPTVGMLGFGDIVIPGLTLCYSFWCDSRLRSETRRFPLYSVLTLFGYELGLGLVYVLLYVMRRGQPALIFLIPCTLLPFMAAAVLRGDFYQVWNGFPVPAATNLATQDAESDANPETSNPEAVLQIQSSAVE